MQSPFSFNVKAAMTRYSERAAKYDREIDYFREKINAEKKKPQPDQRVIVDWEHQIKRLQRLKRGP